MYDVYLHHVTLQDTFAILWNHLVMTQQCLQVTFCTRLSTLPNYTDACVSPVFLHVAVRNTFSFQTCTSRGIKF